MFLKIFLIFGITQIALAKREQPPVRYEYNLPKDNPEIKYFTQEGLKTYLLFMKENGYEKIKADKCINPVLTYTRLKIAGTERQYFIKVSFNVEGSPSYPGSFTPVVKLECEINVKTKKGEPIISYCVPVFKQITLKDIQKRREEIAKFLEHSDQ
ncbi:uncharacterized protein LOC141533658 [Cotesia typhae]|uniref:uncharacterized protein LOC141533658 n=1 Tax=Cotesia typhae TaxID=2053667 RepID=UPI003D68F148